jgi:hypothetical protein
MSDFKEVSPLKLCVLSFYPEVNGTTISNGDSYNGKPTWYCSSNQALKMRQSCILTDLLRHYFSSMTGFT